MQSATADANLYGNPSCEHLRKTIGNTYGIDAEQIVCGNGSEELLDIVGRCFARAGDEIVISEFGYIQFPIVANRVGATLVKAREVQYTSHVDNLLAAVTDNTRIVFLANPNNPTGTMISEAELRLLAQSLPTHIVLVIDLAYGEFAGPSYNERVRQLASEFDHVVITQTFSKAFGLAGLRVGWCYAPLWMVPQLYSARGMGTVNAVAQVAACAALEDIGVVSAQVSSLVAERARLAKSLLTMDFDVIPSSANFLMIAPHRHNNKAADQLSTHLFDHTGILVNQTREAGLERFVRFSVSLPEHNTLFLQSAQAFRDSHVAE